MAEHGKHHKAPPAPARRPRQPGAFSGVSPKALLPPRTRAGKSGSASGHGRRNRGFVPDSEALRSWERDPAKLPQENFSVHLAPRGFLGTLLEELGDRTATVFGRLVLAEGTEPAAWAQTSWLNPRWMPVKSIKDAASQLCAIQRNWRAHHPDLVQGCNRRMALVEEALPHLSLRPLAFGDPAPSAPLGAFTLWSPSLMLASSRTTSPFPDGEVHFEENRTGPPSRAYLKLWESFTLLGLHPKPGELCIDLGAAPGSWTWVLSGLGASVFSVDKAPLEESIAQRPNVNHCLGSGFGLEPSSVGTVDWLFSDMICYPARLLALVRQWIAQRSMHRALCTLKFQSETDHETARAFAAIPGSRLRHLSCNKHELTWFWEASSES